MTDPIGKSCDRCLAEMLAAYPEDMRAEAIAEYHDLPTATLVRSLNDYFELIEGIIPSRVH